MRKLGTFYAISYVNQSSPPRRRSSRPCLPADKTSRGNRYNLFVINTLRDAFPAPAKRKFTRSPASLFQQEGMKAPGLDRSIQYKINTSLAFRKALQNPLAANKIHRRPKGELACLLSKTSHFTTKSAPCSPSIRVARDPLTPSEIQRPWEEESY
jgi:hypothetical protein